MNTADKRKLGGLVVMFVIIVVGIAIWATARQIARAREDQLLISAVKNGGLHQILASLERGADPNGREAEDLSFAARVLPFLYSQSRGRTPLGIACETGTLECVDTLLRFGANPNIDSGYDTPLCVAAERGDEALVNLLLESGAEVNDEGWFGPPLVRLVHDKLPEEKQIRVMRILLSNGADPNAKHGYALITSAVHGNEKAVAFLLEHGANVNIQEPDLGWTALGVAACNGEARIVRMLLDSGARPDVRDNTGRTPLRDAKVNSKWEVIRMLVNAGAKQ